MSRRRLVKVLCLLALLPLLPVVLFAQAQQPSAQGLQAPRRLVVKVRGTLAQDIELALPLAQMALVPGQSGNPLVEDFMSRHAARRLAPLYPGIVRQKRTQGLSDLEIATRIRQQFARRGARLHASFQPPEVSRTYVLELDAAAQGDIASALSSLRADPAVEYAEADQVVRTNVTENDPYLFSSGSWGQSYPDLWGIQKIGAPAAWNTSTGAGVVVAVVDTGIDYNHPDIAANVWTNTHEIPGNGVDDDHNGYIDDIRGWDFIGSSYLTPQQSNDPIDHNGHGTHVAGTIAAVGDNGIGVIGVAWNAQVMAVKSLDDSGTGIESTLAQGIMYAANNGADVISASWGAQGSSQTIADAVNYAYNLGAVFVAAAGNNSEDALNFFPANLWNVITVAASDSNDNLASFSNYGSKIDVAAPGVDILSLQANGTQLGPVVSPGYIRLSGTSMATPHVSGLAALILSENPEYSNEEVRQVLRSSATDLGTPGYDLSFGYGREDATAAVGVSGALEAKISSPLDGTVVQGPITISGVARGTGFSHYILEYGSGSLPSTWTTIQTGNAAVSGTLGYFDPTSLPDSTYDLRLTVYNTSGQTFVDRVQVVANPIFIQSPAVPSAPTSATTFKNGAVILVTGNAVGGNFQDFTVDWAPGIDATSGWQTTGITLAGGGSAPVAGGALGSWDTSSIATAGYYTIRLTVNAASTSRQVVTMVYLQPDLLSTNWPQLLTEGTYLSAGVVPALNADGSLRLVASSNSYPPNGLFYAIPLTGPIQGTLLPGYGSFQQPAVANLDGNPGDEAVVADSNGIDVVRSDNSTYQLTTSTTLDYQRSQILIEDLLGNSQWETLALGSNYQNQFAYISAWKPDGSLLNNNFPIRIADQNPMNSWYNRTRLLVGDINGDGKKEIVAWEGLSSSTFTLRLFANDGSAQTWSVPVLSGIPEAMAAADLDHNGKLETILVYYSGSQAILTVFQPEGTTRSGWPLTLPNPNQYSQSFLAVGDLNQDGHKEIVYSHETYLYVFKDNGAIFSSQWPLQTSAPGYASVVIGDVNGDGLPEIVTTINTIESTSDPYFKSGSGYYDEKLLALRKDGSISKSWQLTGGNGFDLYVYPAPAIGDFNQDGVTDIGVSYEVTGSPTAVPGIVEVLTTGAKYNAALDDWPLIHQNARNTSVLPSSVLGPGATFLGLDSTTRGSWQTNYGGDGYSIPNSAQSLPAYTTLASQNALPYTWSGSTSDPRALKIPGGSSNIASAWYNNPSFTFDVNITDGSSHRVALYALDWDSQARSETIQILNANNPSTVLDTETISGYQNGVYLVWTISGHVTIRVTADAGPNAVISGIFFGGAPPPPAAQLGISKTHTGNFTQGQQNANYAVSVSNAAGGGPTAGLITVTESSPAGLTLVSMNGSGWNCGTNSCTRSNALSGGASYPVITVTVNVAANATSPQVNQVSVSGGGSATATASDSTVVTVASSGGGGAAAAFLAKDTTTQGNWQTKYGGDGYSLAAVTPQSVPGYALFSVTNGSPYTWVPSTSDPRALLLPGSTSQRTAATWYNGSAFSMNVNVAGQHQVALYALDWDNNGRTETVKVVDASNASNVLDTETLSGFSGGVYLVWNITGNVNITITASSGNAVVSSVFFGTSNSNPTPVLGITKSHTGNFTQGQQNATYTVTVSNSGNAVTSGPVTVTESLPSGLTLVSLAGTGWDCPANGNTCTSNNALNAGSSYLPITVTVNVAANATSPQVNQVSVSGGGSTGASASDSTTINALNTGGATAQFIKLDTATQGNWQGVYGGQGYNLANVASPLIPNYATLAVQGQANYTWSASTTDARATLLPGSPSQRIAATWYNYSPFSFDLNFTDGNAHSFALYALDWDSQGRSETVQIFDAVSNALLNKETLSNFSGGAYLVWSITGHVKIVITLSTGPNAVISAAFFN